MYPSSPTPDFDQYLHSSARLSLLQSAIGRAKEEYEKRTTVARTSTEKFRTFVPNAWHVAEPARDFIPNWHIDAISDHLQAVGEGSLRRLLITIPPGHAKSLLVSVLFPAWQWIDNPAWRCLATSYDGDLAIRDSVRSRNVIQSEWYNRTFEPKWKLAGDQNVKSRYENTMRGFRMSTGVGGKGTGFRGDCILVDDPLNAKKQYSKLALDEVIFWFDQVMSSRLNDQATGAIIIIMQRLSEMDLAAHVIERGGYEHLNLPSEFEPERRAKIITTGWEDPRTEPSELLFPKFFPQTVINEAKKNLGERGFAAQHQQRPSPAEGDLLKRHWWRYWKPMDSKLGPVRMRQVDNTMVEIEAVELVNDFDQILQSWDCAFKDMKDSDFVAGGVIATRGADRFLIDARCARLDLLGTIRGIQSFDEKWPEAGEKLVEDKANGPAVIQSLKHRVSGLIAINPEGGKYSRAAAVSPEVESGNWYLPHPSIAPWVNEFIENCACFPNAKNDDWVDMWSQAGNRIRERGKGMFQLWRQKAGGRGQWLKRLGDYYPAEPDGVDILEGLEAPTNGNGHSNGQTLKNVLDNKKETPVQLIGKLGKVAKTVEPEQKNCCPVCKNAFPGIFSEAWKCVACGSTGPLVNGQLQARQM